MKNGYLYWSIFVAVMGSLLFGVNMAAVSGAVSLLQEHFLLNEVQLGIAVSAIVIGAMIGAFTAGPLSDKHGRKALLIAASLLFSISALGSAFAGSLVHLIVARVIGGIAVGSVSVVIPTYISEVSPAKMRGTLGTLNQLGIVIGILLAYVFDWVVVDMDEAWRWMLGSPLVFAVPSLLLLLFAFPESPRWLLQKGRTDKARAILSRITSTEEAEKEIKLIAVGERKSSSSDKISIADLFRGRMGWILFLGIMLAALQQITGINAIIAYAPTIFEKTGVGDGMALLQSVLVGVINFLFTLVAVWLIDKAGRKVLLLGGAAGMIVSLGYITYAFSTGNVEGTGILIALLGYIAFFAASLAPVMWVVTSEIYPTKVRGLAMSVSTAVSWVCTFVVVQFFPWALANLGGATTFGFFGALSVFAFIFIQMYIPETKGKSLEEIETELGLKDGESAVAQ